MGELLDFLDLVAVLSLEHGNRQVAELLGLRLDREARDPAQQARPIEKAIEDPGRVAEEGGFLLQVDVNAAEKDTLLADVDFVRADWGIGRNK